MGSPSGALRWVVCPLWAVAMAVATGYAQPDSLSASARVDRTRITVGDPIVYTVAVLSPPGASVAWPGRDVALGEFEVRSFTHLGPVSGPNGSQVDTLRYVVTVYAVGQQTIPALSVPSTLRGGTRKTVVTQPITITVVSVITDEPTDIRDLKAPAEIPGRSRWYVWVGVLVLLLAVIAGGLYLYRRRKRRVERAVEPPVSPRLPHEVAYAELDRLASLRLIEQGQIKEHYTAASETIRRYLAARYEISAMEITTTELLDSLASIPVPSEHIRAIGAFLRECDLVKFAKYTPDRETMDRSIDAARGLVDLTKESYSHALRESDLSPPAPPRAAPDLVPPV